MAETRSTRSSQSPSRYSSGGESAEVDDRILFGMEKLVNKIKVKEHETQREPSIKSKRSDRSKKTHRSQRSKRSQHDESVVEPPFQKLPNDAEILSATSKKSKKSERSKKSSRSKKWSKSSGVPEDKTKLDFNLTEPSGGLFDFFGNDLDRISTQPSFLNDDRRSKTSSRKSARMDEELKHLEPIIEPVVKPKTREQELDEKVELLAEWEELAKKAKDRNLKRFTIESDLEDIRLEIKKVRAQKKRENALKFMGLATYTTAKGIEVLFDKLEFINIDLGGWSGSLKHNMSDFDEVFSELYEKYRGSGKGLPPEIRFLILFLTSAVNFVIMNKAPQAIADFLNAGQTRMPQRAPGGRQGVPPRNTGGYREMTPPDIEGDPELEELLFDLEQRKDSRLGGGR